MMINGWKTAQEIRADYDLTITDFQHLLNECQSGKYKDAIVLLRGQLGRDYVYIAEDKWQKFLLFKSQQNKKRLRKQRKLDESNEQMRI